MFSESEKCETHHGSNDQAQAEERLECRECRAHRVRKFLGDDGKARREKSRIPKRLDDSDNEGEGDEHRVTWNAIEQSEQDRGRASGEDSTIEQNLQSHFRFVARNVIKLLKVHLLSARCDSNIGRKLVR